MPLRKANELGHGATNQIALPRDALQPVYPQTASSYYQNLQVLLGFFLVSVFHDVLQHKLQRQNGDGDGD